MRDKTEKRGWPRLHLSTAVILFLLSSFFLGIQFYEHETSDHKIVVEHFKNWKPHSGIIFPPYINEYSETWFTYGIPFTVCSSGNTRNIGDFKDAPGGYLWHYRAMLANAGILILILIAVALLLELRLKRRTLKPSPDNV